MRIHFFKYQGAGNDFIFLDAFAQNISLTAEQITSFCNRKLGVGADGLAVLSPSEEADFTIDYFNADGSREGLCANATRCAFLWLHGNIKQKKPMPAYFKCHAGKHQYIGIVQDAQRVALNFPNIYTLPRLLSSDMYYLHTGAPHKVCIMPHSLSALKLEEKARPLRYDAAFPQGVNVNFAYVKKGNARALDVRTYEKGVEAETLSCGTGSVASALSLAHHVSLMGAFEMDIDTLGGLLKVRANRVAHGFEDIWLEGPAAFVFEGDYFLEK